MSEQQKQIRHTEHMEKENQGFSISPVFNKQIEESQDNDLIIGQVLADKVTQAREKLNPSLNNICLDLGIDFILLGANE